MGEATVDPGGVFTLMVDKSKVCIEVVVVGEGDVLMVVFEVVTCREAFLVCAGTVVFHWWVEKGLVTLAGRVTSWSPTVDKRDSGTVGRSQAGRLLTDSSVGRKTFGRISITVNIFYEKADRTESINEDCKEAMCCSA